MFQPVPGNVNFPEQELAIGQFWKERRIYEKSLEQRAGAPPFVFYEGPPTANGMPHPGHCLTRAIKDLFPRYQTMRGRRCERKAGWDTHGLPVEVEVCKELGIHSKEEIEAYGIEPFIQKCQQSVWRYMQEWERLTERIGFWVDLKNAYATYHQSFVESVWWSLKNLFDRGLLYQGHKIVWWWAQGGTALSSGEVGEGYRSVADPSVYVKFPLLDDDGKLTDTSLLVWTTTPWTLPSNQFAAVNPDLEYVFVTDEEIGEKYVLAAALFESVVQKAAHPAKKISGPVTETGGEKSPRFTVTNSCKGKELVGRRYVPPFDCFRNKGRLKSLAANGTLLGSKSVNGAEDPLKLLNEVHDLREKFSEMIDHTLAPRWSSEWKIVPGEFVEITAGTGGVHIAPAFGEVDYEVLHKAQAHFALPRISAPLINCVGPDGKFTGEAPDYCLGRWVKDCDRNIIRDLKQRGLLFHQEQYVHDYPFCPRAEQDALIQYPRQSWFIRTSQFKDDMLANNAKINWLPEHIKDGRFGKFLETNVDWALSRERYWGTPLPIWKCQATGKMEAVGSYDELMSKPGVHGSEVWEKAKQLNPHLPDDLRIHKPYIDEIVYDSPFEKGAHMRRVPEVIDCWYDAGSMPFAQWGFPHTKSSDQHFKSQFPADFISEAIDQTRGWFYAQLAISTLMFGVDSTTDKSAPGSAEGSARTLQPYPHPFRNCIVLGHMLGEDGLKMSKRKRNYLPPSEIFDKYGADALRWYFFANQPPWTSIRYSEQAIKDSIPEFLLRLWNVYSFFVIYANIDGFEPKAELSNSGSPPLGGEVGEHLNARTLSAAKSYRPIKERNELDRWILSELNRSAAGVIARMDAYDNFGACGQITEFVDALSNWYVRRSRDRFWAADKRSTEKLDAYWTLYECLLTTAKLVAPFVPFVAETLWQNLAGVYGGARSEERGTGKGDSLLAPRSSLPAESVHLCDYPVGDAAIVDEALSARMNLVREIASLGRNARGAANLKVRQPLAKVEVVLVDTSHQKWLEEHADLIAEELNVKGVEFTTHGEQYINYSVVPNFKRLGPRLGKNMPAAKKLLAEIDAAKMLSDLKLAGKVTLGLPDGSSLDLDNEDIEVRLQAKEGWAAAQGKACVVVLATELTPELIAEGLARDVVRIVQDQRKDINCQYTDRIEIGLVTDYAELAGAIEKFREFIAQETLANNIVNQVLAGVEPVRVTVLGYELAVYVRVVK